MIMLTVSGFASVFTSMLSTEAKPRVSEANGTQLVVEPVHRHVIAKNPVAGVVGLKA